MLRRTVDLSLVTYPSAPGQFSSPPAFPDVEDVGKERPRKIMQALSRIEPFHLDSYSDEIIMDITLGHSTPHTHVDVFLHYWYWFEHLFEKEKTFVKDLSQIEINRMVGPAALVDLSDFDLDEKIPLSAFKERAEHIQNGDILIVKTGHPELYKKYKGRCPGSLPLITPEIAKWLVREKAIRSYCQDMPPNGVARRWWDVERVFYANGVLMTDYLANLDELHEKRFFVNVGVVMRGVGADDSPARVVAVQGGSYLQEGQLIDLFSPIKIGDIPKPPFERSEPYELSSEIMKRYRVNNFQVPLRVEYGSWAPILGWMGFKVFSSCLGTHIEVPYGVEKNWNLATIPSKYLCGKAAIVDLTNAVGPSQNVSVCHLEQKGKHIQEKDIVLIRTNFSDNYYYRPDFLRYTPGFRTNALRWLVDKGVKMLITDAAWVEKSPWGNRPPSREGHSILFKAGVPAVLCAVNMWRLQKDYSFVFCSPLPLAGVNTSPCRVLVVEEWE